VNDNFDVIPKLLYLEAMNGTTAGEDLFERLSSTLERLELS
jgi:hypothetical protein